MPTPIHEADRRRESFREDHSVPVVMSDGQAWFLPEPWLELTPAFRDGKALCLTRRLAYDDEIDAVIEALSGAESEGQQVLFAVMLAALLLKKNYDLTDDECGQVVRHSSDSAESRAMLVRVTAIATGHLDHGQ